MPGSEASGRFEAMTAPNPMPWHNQPAGQVLARLDSTADGLSLQEAAQRLAAHGRNEGTRISPMQIFPGRLKGLVIGILIVAGVVSGALGVLRQCRLPVLVVWPPLP